MRTLLLLRHGKSDWETAFDRDRDRPLARRGEKAAERMGRFLTGIGAIPDRIVTSPARRARATVELAAEAGGWAAPIEIGEAVYEATPRGVLAEIQRQPATAEMLLFTGHEPTFSALAALLIGGGSLRLPTAAVAAIGFEAKAWSAIEPGAGQLLWLVNPRLLEVGGG